MYAIIKAGGQQHRVEENSIIDINKVSSEKGEEIVIDEVLIFADDNGVKIGTPIVPGAKVTATVVSQFKDKKIDAFTYKPKKHTQRHWGHRQQMTKIKINKIQID